MTVVREYIVYIIWQVVYRIACYIKSYIFCMIFVAAKSFAPYFQIVSWISNLICAKIRI